MIGKSNDTLDDLLARARWPAVTSESTFRLTQRWERIRARRRFAVWRVAAAAVLVLGIGVIAIAMRNHADKRIAVVAPPARTVELSGREPTPRELILMRVAKARPEGPPVAMKAQVSEEDALARVVEDAQGRVSLDVARRFCALATARSLPLVLKLARDPQLRPATIGAIARLADASTLAATARQFDVPADRRKLIAALFNRQTPQALPLYLELVREKQTRADALASVEKIDQPPIDELIAALQCPRADLGLAAAWTLGRIDGPVVTRRLIQMIEGNQNRREAFIALAGSRGKDAQEYVRQAAASRRFSSLARSAIAQANLPNLRSQS